MIAKDPDITAMKSPLIQTERISLDGVPALLFRPKVATDRTIIYFHGGGFVFGSSLGHFKWTQRLSLDSNAVVISVDYRLAPQHPYPAAAEDAIRATKAVFKMNEILKINTEGVLVGGDSAGANLATIVGVEFVKIGRADDIKAIVLIMPMLQIVDFSSLPSFSFYHKLLPCMLGIQSLLILITFYTSPSVPSALFAAKYAAIPYTYRTRDAIYNGEHVKKGDMVSHFHFIK